MTDRKRYALVGTGDRGIGMFAAPILTRFGDVGELVGMHDANPLRAEAANRILGADVAVYETYDAMLAEARPDVVLVASMDSVHHEHIVAALRAEADVVTEKPLATDEVKCREILAAQRETGREVRVAFNYRYVAYFAAAKELLSEGTIGRVLSVDFHWYLDRRHGADYFRRWHRRMENGGGLFVHKATHHFDLVNWWLGDRPEAVVAAGDLLFYGPTREERGERCLKCAHRGSCEFHVDLAADDYFRALYLEAEAGDGYHRDGCVFDPEIDIFDTMTAIARYERGALVSYSLNAYMPYEGMRAAVNGTAGRLELEAIESRRVPHDELRVYRMGEEEPDVVVSVPRAEGGHGGGDELLQEDLFRGPLEDPHGRAAGLMDGAYSILAGVAANRSTEGGGWVRIADLL